MMYLINNYNKTYSKFNEDDFNFYHYDENDNEKVIDNLKDLEKIIEKYNENGYDDFEILEDFENKKDYAYEGGF